MIRSMTLSDAAAVAELEKLCFSDPWSERSVASETENPLSLWLVAEEGGKLVGYVGSQSVAPESDLMNLAVAPEARGKGIARELMLELMRRLHERGMQTLTLEVRVSNAPAIALYTKLGFVQIGRRPRYYVNPREDALILRKELRDADFIRGIVV